MNEPACYPPPDFGSPPPGSFQHQQPRSSNFHPAMWVWSETPTELSWERGNNAGWHNGSAEGCGFPTDHGNRGPTRPYGQSFGHEWHQGGHRGGRQSSGAPGHHGKKRNRKEPEYSHFCDTCDRGFKNQEKYSEHVSQHVKCSVADCSFMAHEKIVCIHWKNNHAPGAKRIKLDTPEEIAKWREERRKNYPTLQNMEKKRKVVAVREETGAVLETAQFGRMRGRGRGHRWSNRGRHPRGPHPQDCRAKERPKPPTQPHRDGDPLGALATSDHDSDREESRTGGLVVAPKHMSSALGSLVANYGSLSDSDGEPEATPIQRQQEPVQENQSLLNPIPPNLQDKASTEGSSPSTEAQRLTSDPRLLTPSSRRARRGVRGGRRQDTPQSRRPTLLEMLLAPDIRHERNVLLQCVRYITRNHFFGLESRAHSQEKTGNNQGHEILNHLGCPGGSNDPTAESFTRNTKQAAASDSNCSDLTPTDRITPISDMYDDEIWESTNISPST